MRERSEHVTELDYEKLERKYPLYWALSVKDYTKTLRLIPLTPDLNAVDPMGKTPLTIFIFKRLGGLGAGGLVLGRRWIGAVSTTRR